ncbi:gp6 domain containing protein [uncultured Caudovirales phage]|uniref:Gp6 domain containing protein n=1 Tax=uncultured Caudovirales phage TaxID=2100421 RepID=A0A6J5KZD1_9CAUD|nr:gp6 domain containing protein [uncultured Caudovirales phage]
MSFDNYQYAAPFGAQTRNPFNYSKFEQIGRDSLTQWLTLDQITQQLNLFNDESQDSYLTGLEVATRQAIEDFLGLSIFPVSYRVYYGSESLAASPISLDLPEVSLNNTPSQAGVTITSVGYWNDSFPPTFVTVGRSNYYYDASGNKVIVNSLPTDINTVMTAPLIIEYATVANPLASYAVIQQAGLLLLTHLYNNRSDTTETKLKQIPFGVEALLRPYKPLVM